MWSSPGWVVVLLWPPNSANWDKSKGVVAPVSNSALASIATKMAPTVKYFLEPPGQGDDRMSLTTDGTKMASK